MRVCQFRHYGAIQSPQPEGQSTLTEFLVLQTQPSLSILCRVVFAERDGV
jgi:hypothetical protein